MTKMLELGDSIKVYRNLHKKCYSVQHKGLVVAHLDTLIICSPTFLVRESGRQRVLKEKRKNVHAFIKGTFSSGLEKYQIDPSRLIKVSYNPYQAPTFVRSQNIPVHEASFAYLMPEGVFIKH